MKKTNTVRVNGNMIFKGQKLTLGMDLGDHWSCYCVLDEAGKIILEQKVAMTPEAMKQTFAKIPQSLIALDLIREVAEHPSIPKARPDGHNPAHPVCRVGPNHRTVSHQLQRDPPGPSATQNPG